MPRQHHLLHIKLVSLKPQTLQCQSIMWRPEYLQSNRGQMKAFDWLNSRWVSSAAEIFVGYALAPCALQTERQ